MDAQVLKTRIKAFLWFFVFALVISGLTAFPLEWEVSILQNTIGEGTFMDDAWPSMAYWISFVYQGLSETYRQYPFIAYGTDWLAFAHIVIAVAFLGPIREPIKNVWVIEFGMIACVLVIPLAMIAGAIRGIPFFWRLFDCAFGVFGIIPLWLARRNTLKIIEMEAS